MRAQSAGWIASPHHAAATCNDCHVPHTSFLAKWLGKARNGYHHSKAFTLQDFPDPIRIRPGNADVLQRNCIRCHREMVSGIVGHAPPGGAGDADPADPATDPPACVGCHRTVGHGAPW
jgi:cytochrome c nitrite reductase small subunit